MDNKRILNHLYANIFLNYNCTQFKKKITYPNKIKKDLKISTAL